MIDYGVVIYLGFCMAFLTLGIRWLVDSIKDDSNSDLFFSVLAMFISGIYFTTAIMKIILWVRGL